MPDQPTADLRTLALNAVREGDHALSDLGECGRLDDQTAVVAAVLAAVLPAHRAMVLAEAAEAIENLCECAGETDPAIVAECEYRKAAALVRGLAATGPTTTPASTETAERGEAVPEEGPDGHSGAQVSDVAASYFVMMSAPTPRPVTSPNPMFVPTPDGLLAIAADGTTTRYVRDEATGVYRRVERDADCGHDLEAFERQAAKVVELMTDRDEARAELADADRRRFEFEERVSAQVEDLRADVERLTRERDEWRAELGTVVRQREEAYDLYEHSAIRLTSVELDRDRLADTVRRVRNVCDEFAAASSDLDVLVFAEEICSVLGDAGQDPDGAGETEEGT